MNEPAPSLKIHLGIYGVVIRDDKILLLKKGRGPYRGLFDLPRGSIEHGENLVAAIQREFREETGLEVLSTALLDVAEYHCTWYDDGIEKPFHHVALYYRVELGDGDISSRCRWSRFVGGGMALYSSVSRKYCPGRSRCFA